MEKEEKKLSEEELDKVVAASGQFTTWLRGETIFYCEASADDATFVYYYSRPQDCPNSLFQGSDRTCNCCTHFSLKKV